MESVPVRFQVFQILLMGAAVFPEPDLPSTHMNGKEEEEEKGHRGLDGQQREGPEGKNDIAEDALDLQPDGRRFISNPYAGSKRIK